MNPSIVLALIFIVGLFLGIPVGVCLGIAALVGVYLSHIPLSFIAKTVYTAIDSFAIIAVPMFILAGSIMEKGGLTERLIRFSQALVGRKTGGLAIVTVLACTLFGAISGSGPATTAAIGGIMIPAMIKARYSKGFAGGIAACSGGIGAVIPPSILMIMYGISAEQSITALFIAGIIPGIILAIFLMVTVYFISRFRNYTSDDGGSFTFKRLFKAANDAKWALLAPVIVLGGIYGGVFTVTEASVIAVVYSIIVGSLFYKSMSWRDYLQSVIDTGKTTGTVLIVLMMGMVFARVLTINQIPQQISRLLIANIQSKVLLILLIDALLIFIGMWMESVVQFILLTPLLLPAAIQLGIHPIQFGLMFTIACEIGFETPPLGVNLFVASEIAKTSIEEITKESLFFIMAEIAALLLISYVPELSLFIPRLMGLIN
jgi:C4-dicarboxylate transporter DctM subunit